MAENTPAAQQDSQQPMDAENSAGGGLTRVAKGAAAGAATGAALGAAAAALSERTSNRPTDDSSDAEDNEQSDGDDQ